MANRNFSNGGKLYSMHVMPVLTTCSITIGATGAVTSFKGATVASVTRAGTGLYDIVLQANTNFNAIIAVTGNMQSPVSGLSGVSAIETQNAPSTSMAVAAAPTIRVKTLAAAGTLVDPASGSVVNVMIIANNSSVR